MNFKIDENLPAGIVPGEGLAGTPDSTLVERAYSEGRVLLTMDKVCAGAC